MLIGAHAVLYSADAKRDREFFRNTLNLASVDVGGGWLIFALPPAEIAVHPADAGAGHELFLMCGDVEAFIAKMRSEGIECGPVHEQSWGRLTQLQLPSGGKLGVYQPLHERPKARRAAVAAKKRPRKAARGGRKTPKRKKKARNKR